MSNDSPDFVTIEMSIPVTVKVTVQAKRRYVEVDGEMVAAGWEPTKASLVPFPEQNLLGAVHAYLDGECGEIDVFDNTCSKAASRSKGR